MNKVLHIVLYHTQSYLIAHSWPGQVEIPLHCQGYDTVHTAREGHTGQGEEGGQNQGEDPLLVGGGEGGQGEGERHKNL